MSFSRGALNNSQKMCFLAHTGLKRYMKFYFKLKHEKGYEPSSGGVHGIANNKDKSDAILADFFKAQELLKINAENT